MMSTVEEIERAIKQLPAPERARLAAWFAEAENADWDRAMEEDSAAGKLDFLFDEAAKERDTGELSDWPATVYESHSSPAH